MFFEGAETEQGPPKGYLKRGCGKRSMAGDPLVALEFEAYRAVVRAFGAQSNSLSWTSIFQEKEMVMTNLRKELKVTDEQHRDIIGALKEDEMLIRLREARSNNTAPAPEPPEPPKRKVGPGRPRGSKKKKLPGDEIPAASGQRPQKTKKVQQLSSAPPLLRPEEELQMLSIEDIEAQTDQVEGDVRVELSRVQWLLKAAEDQKTRILDEMGQCGLDENGTEKMDVDEHTKEEEDEEMREAHPHPSMDGNPNPVKHEAEAEDRHDHEPDHGTDHEPEHGTDHEHEHGTDHLAENEDERGERIKSDEGAVKDEG